VPPAAVIGGLRRFARIVRPDQTVASGALALGFAARATCPGRGATYPSAACAAAVALLGPSSPPIIAPMIGLGLDLRVVVSVSLALVLAELSLRTQEQKFRERQVLDPNTGQWVDQTPAEPNAPETGDAIAEARSLLATGKPAKARGLLQQWLKQPPDEERLYEATFLLGETYFESRDFWKALKQYETVAENSSGELFDLANQRSIDVARAFLSGQKRIVWGFLRLPAYAEGVDILDKVWERIPGTRLGELALKLKADYYYKNGDMDLAQDEYNNLVQQYPSGRFIQLAMLRSAEAAEAAFPGVRFDDKPLVEADERYRQLLGTFPAYARREEVPERLEGIRQERAEKDLDIGRWYERTKQPSAAEFYYRLVLKDWPDTLAAADARTRLRALGVAAEDVGVKEPTP
jgi:outer membrane protein assembly factor BamD (BamD/ComL family)